MVSPERISPAELEHLQAKVIQGDSPDFETVMAKILPVRSEVLDGPQGFLVHTQPTDEDRDPRNFIVYALWDEKDVVASVRLEPHIEKGATTIPKDTVCEVRKMVVDEPYQGRRIGKWLLGIAESVARYRGMDSMVLYSTDGQEDFYKRSGYTETSTPKLHKDKYYTEMIKALHG